MRRLITGIAAGLCALALAPQALAQNSSNVTPREAARIQEEARSAVQAAGLQCSVSEAIKVGDLDGGGSLYEVACSSGPGYLLATGNAPQTIDCLQLSSSLERTPPAEGEEPTRCTLEPNQDRAKMITPLAQAAGVTCEIDQAIFMGAASDGTSRYEVGCRGKDGYWLDKSGSGEVKANACLRVMSAGGSCAYTTPLEQIAEIQPRISTNGAPECSIQQLRLMGVSDQGEFFEVLCADQTHQVFRTSVGGAFEQAYTCAQAQTVAGGCELGAAREEQASVEQNRASKLAAAGYACTVNETLRVGQERGESGREVVEFTCAESPTGLVALIPQTNDGDVFAFDCLMAQQRGLTCRLTTEQALFAALTQSLKAGSTDCTVSGFRYVESLGDQVGDLIEVKCSNGEGYYADVPSDRTRPSNVRPCAGLPEGEVCEL